ncbi:hypothetical protein ACJX0J_041700 [Zea mays]
MHKAGAQSHLPGWHFGYSFSFLIIEKTGKLYMQITRAKTITASNVGYGDCYYYTIFGVVAPDLFAHHDASDHFVAVFCRNFAFHQIVNTLHMHFPTLFWQIQKSA